MFGDVTLRPGLSQLWSGKTLVEAFTSQPGFDKAVQAAQTSAPSGGAVDYQQEVLPLLDGEIAAGAFGSTTKPDGLLFMHSKDPEKLLRVLAAAQKAPEPRERYKDALYFIGSGDTTYAASAARGWVVAGSSRTVVEQALDRLDSPPPDSLGASARYLSVVGRLPTDRLGFTFVDTRPIMTSQQVQSSLEGADPAVQQYLSPLTGRIAVSLAAASDGLDLRWESVPDQAQHANRILARGESVRALESLPSDTLAAVAGDSLPALLSGLDEAANAGLRDSLGASAPTLQFQFSRWMGGEFAFGVSKGSLELDSRGRTQGSPDLFMAARVNDSTGANADLVGIDNLLKPKSRTVQGVPLKQIGGLDSGAYYGVGGDWLYAGWGHPEKLLAQRDSQTGGVTAASQFKLVRRAIKPNGIAVFLNLEDGRRALEDLLSRGQRDTYEKSRVLLQPIKALGGDFRTDDNGDAHGELLLAISR